MGKILNNLLSKAIYPYLYCICFLLFKSSAFFKSFNLALAFILIFIFSLFNFLLIRFFKRFTNPEYAAIPLMLLLSAFFHVIGVAKLLHYNYAYIPITFYYFFYLFILLIIILAIRILKLIPEKYSYNLNQILNIFLLCLSGVFCISGLIAVRELRAEERLHFNSKKIEVADTLQKDIVWILMDEYGSTESLATQMGFKNNLDSNLEIRGFQILRNIKSRFNNTLYSVNSIFNLDDTITPSSYYMGVELLKHSSLVPDLEKKGYRFVNLGFFSFDNHPMLADRSGYLHTFLQQISSGTLFGIIYTSWKYSIEKCDEYNQTVFQRLDDSLACKLNQPRFIWAHVTIPHEPFCRDAKGNIQKVLSYSGNDSIKIKKYYLSYLEYGNTKLIQLIDKHPDLKEKIVIISGDHGPRYPYLIEKRLQYLPFAAIHIPEKRDSISFNKIQYISQLPLNLMSYKVSTISE